MGRGAGVAPCVCVLSCCSSPSSRSRRCRASRSPTRRRPRGEAPARADVRKALDKVANDPNLAAERTVNMLRWKEPEPVTDEPWWWQWANAAARWFRGFFGWIAESGRLVVWVLGALRAALLALFVARLVRVRGLPRVPKRVRRRRATCAISTFARRACPTTSAPLRSRFGSAASSARRSRCCIAARCRASCTCTPCRFARRRRKASASRSLGRGSPSRARATRRVSSRLGPRPSMARASPPPAPCRRCAGSSPRRSTARAPA